MKEYFSHDYNARNDKKITRLFMKYGISGIGVYWCIIEMLYEESGYLSIEEYERITFELRTEYDLVKSVIHDFDLFKFDGDLFYSESALNRLNERTEKSQKARESINKRWEKIKKNTNVLQTNNDSNTIKVKESKVKESKIKENKVNILLSQVDESTIDQTEKKYYQIAISFYDLVKSSLKELNISGGEIEKAKYKTWVDPIRLLIENDKRTIEEFREVFNFLKIDEFWKEQIRSTSKLRKKNKDERTYFEVLLEKSRNVQKRKQQQPVTGEKSNSGVSPAYKADILRRLYANTGTEEMPGN